MSINSSNTDLIIREYPFLNKKAEGAYRVEVSVLNLDTLQMRAYTPKWQWHFHKRSHPVKDVTFELVDKDGKVLENVTQYDAIRKGKFSYFKPATWKYHQIHGQTVGETLEKLQNLDLVAYVVEKTLMPAHRDEGDFYQQEKSWVTLYKVPKGLKLSEHIEILQKERTAELI